MQQLDGHSLGLLGAVLGENESKVRDGVKSAVPKILGAMLSVSKIDQGRDMLWRELRDTDATVASRFSKQMYYKDSQALVATGHHQLDGLIGAETNRLIQSVSRESDIGSTSAKRLVGAVTPLVFALVANHQQSKQLDQSELGAVLEQQKNHLSDWERQSDHYFSSAYQNVDDRNEPLFSDLPTAGVPTATVSSVASQSLQPHHFSDHDKDQQSDATNEGSEPTGGAQHSAPDQGIGQAFDQRSDDRRQRKPIAVNPANSGFGVSASNHDAPSRSTAAGTIAAAGAAAIGTAGVAAAAFTPSAKTTTEDSSANPNSDRNETSAMNTYDSKNAVSGFAAADSSTSITNGQEEIHVDDGGNAEPNADSKLWTPDTAQKRSADGTLHYSNRDAATQATKRGSAAGKTSSGWFHWLWWPVLFFGSLLGLSLLFLDPSGRNAEPNGQHPEPSAAATAEVDPASSGVASAAGLTAADENSEGTPEKANADILSSSIQITPGESDAASEVNDRSVAPPNESSTGVETGDVDSSGDNGLTATQQNSGNPTTNINDETTAESNESNQDGVPSLEGSIEVDETAATNNEVDSGEENGDSLKKSTSSLELATSDLEMDADEQVEKLLSAIETELEEINDEAQARGAAKSLSEHIASLEEVLANRDQWEDEIGILVDFQLEEGQKMVAQAKEKAFLSDAVKTILKGNFKKLNALIKPTDDSHQK